MQTLRKTTLSTIVALIVGAYLSTWSAALIQSLVLPALGTGPASVSTSRQPSKEKPEITFAQRRHMPLVKSISIVAPPPTTVDFPSELEWTEGIAQWENARLLPNPLVPRQSARAPPTC